MFGRRLANLLIGLLTLWAIYTIIAWLLDVSIMFPFVEVEPDEIPMGRMHAIRLAVIGTFAFYGLMHLLQGTLGSSQNRKDFFKQSFPILSL